MEMVELPVNKIIPSVFQPRETFDKGELQELADSMKEHGLINPISVKENGDGTYQIIAGERRWRASKFAKMDKIYAIVKAVTNEEQRIESLIENIHRKDLNMIEKGRGMMEIFKILGVDLTPKKISNKINNMRTRRDSSPQDGEEEKIIETIAKTHIKSRQIQTWLDSISADEEVIEDHLKTPENDRIPDSTIARIATIGDKNLQKKTYARIKRQELSFPQASKFVSGIKRLSKKKPKLTKMALESDLPIEFIEEMPEEDEPEIEIPQEEIEDMVQKIKEGEKSTAEIVSRPIVKERHAHWDNESKLRLIANLSKEVFCPYCAKDGSHLRFDCHPKKTLYEIAEHAHTSFMDSTKREEIDERFVEVSEKRYTRKHDKNN